MDVVAVTTACFWDAHKCVCNAVYAATDKDTNAMQLHFKQVVDTLA